jgi:hypothetical protein
MLARVPDMDANDIERFVSTVARIAGDEEFDERGRSAAGAVDLLRRNEPTPGLPRMREVWGAELTNTVVKWFGIGAEAGEVDKDLLDELARLDLITYDQRRERVARDMGVRMSTLDKAVEQRRVELELEDNVTPFMQPVEPWPEPVDGAELLSDLCETFPRDQHLDADHGYRRHGHLRKRQE